MSGTKRMMAVGEGGGGNDWLHRVLGNLVKAHVLPADLAVLLHLAKVAEDGAGGGGGDNEAGAGKMTMGALAGVLGMGKVAVSDAVTRLEGRGWVQRERDFDPVDRRRVWVWITATGEVRLGVLLGDGVGGGNH